jgi:hypothetical protein
MTTSSITQTNNSTEKIHRIFPGTRDNPKSLFDIISENPNSIIFDAADVGYLVNHFTANELRHTIKTAFQRFDGELDYPW